LQKGKDDTPACKTKTQTKTQTTVTPVAAAHAMPELKSGELKQSLEIALDKSNVVQLLQSRSPRVILTAALIGAGKRAVAAISRANRSEEAID